MGRFQDINASPEVQALVARLTELKAGGGAVVSVRPFGRGVAQK